MLSPESNHTGASPCDESHCGGSVSPSSLHDSHSRTSAHDPNNSFRHDDLSSDDPTDFSSLRSPSSLANISSSIELHPQNEALGGSSKHKYIKRPLNAYMIWTRQERKRILSEDPKMKMNEVSKAMGEKWKKMSDKDKKPYFELAKKHSEEHKQVLQDHPELQYAPSKKKGPPKKGVAGDQQKGGQQHSLADSSSVKSCTATPDASRSTTPRGAGLIAPQPIISQSQGMFPSFHAPSSVQLAQVLQGVRSASAAHFGQTASSVAAVGSPVPGSILAPTATFPQSFLQPQGLPQRSTSLLGAIPHSAASSGANAASRTTPSQQVLDLYYTSLCQPAFPNITENPVNTLGMYPPSYLLEQYNQQISQQQQQQQGSGGGGGGPSSATNGGSGGGGQQF